MALYVVGNSITGHMQVIDDKDPYFDSLIRQNGGINGSNVTPFSNLNPGQQAYYLNALQKAKPGNINQAVSYGGQDSSLVIDPFTGKISSTIMNQVDPNGTGQPTPAAPPSPPGGTPPVTGTGSQLTTPTTPVNQPTVPGTDISPFIPATSQQQQDIVNQAITQSQGLAGQNLTQLQSLIGPYIQQQFSQYTDPNSPGNKQMMGELNNVGMADSGAFPQALASRLAPLISQGALQLGEQTLVPSFLNQQQLVSQGADVQSNLGLDPLQRFIEEQNFQQQADLAKQLAQQGASAQFGSGIGGLLGGGLGAGIGGAFGGVPGAFIGSQIGSQGGSAVGGGGGLSWLCTHLKKLGLATEDEVDAVHRKLAPTMVSHPLIWLQYFLFGPLLIPAVTEDWAPIKAVLIDDVLAAETPEEAFEVYCGEVCRLCEKYDPTLWEMEVAV